VNHQDKYSDCLFFSAANLLELEKAFFWTPAKEYELYSKTEDAVVDWENPFDLKNSTLAEIYDLT
jgi:hypothetical protein